MGQLDGKVAIVTGSGRGIGREVALRLARDGAAWWSTTSTRRRPRRPSRRSRSWAAGPWPATATSPSPTSATASWTRRSKRFGGCHIIVNNAGYTWDSVIQKMTDEQWYAILDVHLTAPFRILRAFQQHLRQAVEAEPPRASASCARS